MRIEFDWDPAKAASNIAKHSVSFDLAMLVFHDPLALSELDDTNNETELRWVTLGATGEGGLVLVVHTHSELEGGRAAIRIISARRPTKREIKQYQEG